MDERYKAKSIRNIQPIRTTNMGTRLVRTKNGRDSVNAYRDIVNAIRTAEKKKFAEGHAEGHAEGLAEVLGYSGAIASLAFGITIANMEYFNFKFLEKYQKNKNLKLNENEQAFIGEIGFVLKTFFFVYVGLSIPFSDGKSLAIGAVITAALVVVRIITAKFFSPTSANAFDKSTIAVMIPKGLAAAVLASVPEHFGLEGGTEIKYITFSVVLFSILLCSLLILTIEKFPRVNILLRFVFKSRPKKSKQESEEVSKPNENTAEE